MGRNVLSKYCQPLLPDVITSGKSCTKYTNSVLKLFESHQRHTISIQFKAVLKWLHRFAANKCIWMLWMIIKIKHFKAC